MPRGMAAGLVTVQAKMHGKRHPVERLGKAEVGRRVIHRIEVEHDERFDLAGRHLRCEIGDRLEMIDRCRLDRRDSGNGLADIAKRGIHRMHERTRGGRHAAASDDQALAAMRDQRAYQCSFPTIAVGIRRTAQACRHTGRTDTCSNAPDEAFDLGRRQCQPTVCPGAAQCRPYFDRIQAIAGNAIVRPSPLREVVRIPHAARQRAEQVCIDGDDHRRLVQMQHGIDRFAERQTRRRDCRIVMQRIVAMPARVRIAPQQRGQLVGQRRRCDRAGENA